MIQGMFRKCVALAGSGWRGVGSSVGLLSASQRTVRCGASRATGLSGLGVWCLLRERLVVFRGQGDWCMPGQGCWVQGFRVKGLGFRVSWTKVQDLQDL